MAIGSTDPVLDGLTHATASSIEAPHPAGLSLSQIEAQYWEGFTLHVEETELDTQSRLDWESLTYPGEPVPEDLALTTPSVEARRAAVRSIDGCWNTLTCPPVTTVVALLVSGRTWRIFELSASDDVESIDSRRLSLWRTPRVGDQGLKLELASAGREGHCLCPGQPQVPDIQPQACRTCHTPP